MRKAAKRERKGPRVISRQTTIFSAEEGKLIANSRTATGVCFSSRRKVPRPAHQRLPSDGFFERDASHLFSALSTHPGVASEKALA